MHLVFIKSDFGLFFVLLLNIIIDTFTGYLYFGLNREFSIISSAITHYIYVIKKSICMLIEYKIFLRYRVYKFHKKMINYNKLHHCTSVVQNRFLNTTTTFRHCY